MEIKKQDNFSEWYHEVLDEARVLDQRYNVKGCYAWNPFGFKMKTLVFDKLKEYMVLTDHEETQFPMLIPETALEIEKDHAKGFHEQVFWVTKGGSNELDVPLALRPTSETIIYPMFSLWVQSHADLPLKLFQVVNTFRYETKHTRPLIRDREVSTFKEAHAAHADEADAMEEMKSIQKAYSDFFDDLCVPYFISRRPEWDKFPGAKYSVAWDQTMPDGKTLQVATSHYYGENFSEGYKMFFEDEEGKQQKIHITTHGISSRCVAGMISAHGDDKGLVLPPEFAPIQVVVIPIVFKDSGEEVMKVASKVFSEIKFRKKMDDSEDSPGSKYYKWELKGVPIRVEIGPKDVEKNQVVVVRRDTKEKVVVPIKNLGNEIPVILDKITKNLRERAKMKANEFLVYATSLEEVLKAEKEGKVIKTDCCEKCMKKLEDSFKTSYEVRGVLLGEKAKGKCVVCKKKCETMALSSNAY